MKNREHWPASRPEDQAIIDDLTDKTSRRLREFVLREMGIAAAAGPGATFATATVIACEALDMVAGYIDVVVGGRHLEPGDRPSAESMVSICLSALGIEDMKLAKTLIAKNEAAYRRFEKDDRK